MATLNHGEEDEHPAMFERRYSEFLKLYTALLRDHPDLLQAVQFPPKVVLGNFSESTVSTRKTGFEQLLDVIGSNVRLRYSPAVIEFMTLKELTYALNCIVMDKTLASYMIENNFRLLNKLQTDRSPPVIRHLCLLVALEADLGTSRALDLASLAVRRFQGVSDADLLKYYVPLLEVSLDLSKKLFKDSAIDELQEHLANLRLRGFVVRNSIPRLLDLLVADLRTSTDE